MHKREHIDVFTRFFGIRDKVSGEADQGFSGHATIEIKDVYLSWKRVFSVKH
jgi:hypothetical protein